MKSYKPKHYEKMCANEIKHVLFKWEQKNYVGTVKAHVHMEVVWSFFMKLSSGPYLAIDHNSISIWFVVESSPHKLCNIGSSHLINDFVSFFGNEQCLGIKYHMHLQPARKHFTHVCV